MEFHEKLQELRKQRGITQEDLARSLFVSRTAVSKWESGRGYPSIDSLKVLSKYYGVSIDELLSGDELLSVAAEDTRQKAKRDRDLVFGLLDCSHAMFFFLPFFGQTSGGVIREVPLPGLTELQLWLRVSYYSVVIGAILIGVLTLALQNNTSGFWLRNKNRLSLLCSVAGVFLFIISRQPYAAAFVFVYLLIKALMLKNRQ